MAKKYSKEFKEAIIKKLLPPSRANVPDIARETGIPKDTLYTWRTKYRNSSLCDLKQSRRKGHFSNEEKLAIVIETASLNEIDFGEYCRRKGIYPDQVIGWKNIMKQSLSQSPSKADRELQQQQVKSIQKLRSELRRKEKALAEAAALLVLEKKIQSLWGEPEGEKSTSEIAKK
jgi:transposase